jgi:hypothetical protein
MSEQAAATATTPATGAVSTKPRIIAQREGQPVSAKGSVDAIVDSVFDEGLPDDIKALEGLDMGAADQGPDLSNLEVEDDDGAESEGDDASEDRESESDESPEPERKTADRSVGSEDNPYTVKTLPADKFVKLKVDGEETVVPMKELADGYIRQQTFNKRLKPRRPPRGASDRDRAHRGQRAQRAPQELSRGHGRSRDAVSGT